MRRQRIFRGKWYFLASNTQTKTDIKRNKKKKKKSEKQYSRHFSQILRVYVPGATSTAKTLSSKRLLPVRQASVRGKRGDLLPSHRQQASFPPTAKELGSAFFLVKVERQVVGLGLNSVSYQVR